HAAEHAVHDVLEHAPDRPDRAVGSVGAELHGSRVALAEARVEETAAQRGQGLAHVDLLGRTGQGVPAFLPARAAHEAGAAGAAEQAHHLGHVRAGDALLPAQLRDGQALAGVLAPQAQEAAEAVLLLRGELHMSPSWRRAASDILVWSQGGSSCTWTSASFT